MKVERNFLPLDETQDLLTDIKDNLWDKSVWKINKGNWADHLTDGYAGLVAITKLADHYPDTDKKISWAVQQHIGRQIDWAVSPLVLQVWGENSGVNWHSDNHADFAFTIYLNDYWKEEWGGLLQYKYFNDDKFLVPEPGTLVLNTDQTWHRVTETKTHLLRYTIQCFGKYHV